MFVDNLLLTESNINPVFTKNLYLWTDFINEHHWEQRPFDKIILDMLSYCVEGRISRLMISIPPQHGKSTFITESFLSYLMSHCPNENIILASYNKDLATEFAGNIKDTINYYGEYTIKKPKIRNDTKAKNKFKFERPYRGQLLARGSSGAITGFEANVFVIDDPIKDYSDAMSLAMQDKLERWYKGTVEMRLRKRANGTLPPLLILLAQRLHHRDLHGIIKENEPVINAKEAYTMLKRGLTIPPDTWVDLNLPGICEDPDNDILGRRRGEVLWENHRNYENLMALKRSVGSTIFQTQIQGNPPKLDGNLFKHNWFYDSNGEFTCTIPYEFVPPTLRQMRSWDLAARFKKTDLDGADEVCGVLTSKDPLTKTLYVYNMVNGKFTATHLINTLRYTIQKDGYSVITNIEQEGGSQSVLFLTQLMEELNRYTILHHKPVTGKIYRSMELQALAETGRLKFVTYTDRDNHWIRKAVDQLIEFDGEESNAREKKHDDIVDSISAAANYWLMEEQTPRI